MREYACLTKAYEIQYFVDEANKVVICRLEDWYENSYIGKALCSNEDEFNVNRGKKIAYNRAMRSLNCQIRSRLKGELAKVSAALETVETNLQNNKDIIRSYKQPETN